MGAPRQLPRRRHADDRDLRRRTIGKAQVARLRWTLGNDDEALKYTHAPWLTQVAVTDEGLYLMWAAWDDTKITEELKKKSSECNDCDGGEVCMIAPGGGEYVKERRK